jgi:hypothetical protein
MKSKKILFGFLLLTIFAISMMTAANAVTTIGVKIGDSYTWQVKTLDPSYPAGSIRQGDEAKMTITNIVESGAGWTINYAYWSFGVPFSGSGASSSDFLPKDPTSWSIGLICGLPVADYLTAAYGSTFASGNKLIFAIGVYSEEITYDTSTGVMSDMKYSEGGKVMFEIALVPAIPGYELSILLGVSAISTIGLIYIVMKKK